MIRECTDADFNTMFRIINDAAQAYKGVVPDDRWHEPYMPIEELRHEIEDGVVFCGLEHDGELLGVMGIQDKGDVTLIRHAYVRTRAQQQGIVTRLLRHLESMKEKPILVGTWADAPWQYHFMKRTDTTSCQRKKRIAFLESTGRFQNCKWKHL